ncbi:MAG TPA: winged helix-turn-helix domain-containing protein [Baekduia sp.]|uniref:winged helix-turn-helix domain-containing protein n=1 Tax=Baekduia sp. TaxID=2600305 RepID=UPI002D769959|nr:winged helix-turn-helix domain-containing protein [Baekduia sp.]HET6510166.1 winged helix-turn-helix domain-containing protein [Baekduia sp.]
MLDPDFLAAIGHPVRLRALVLFERAPGSASDLAALSGLTTSATAYHVRRLADAGLIVEAGTRGAGAGAERLWRTRATGWSGLEDLLVEAVREPPSGDG